MNLREYLRSLPIKTQLSDVKITILTRLWGSDKDGFPKPWVSSAELLGLTGQKYFDRRTRELRDQLGCDIESSYQTALEGHAWRLRSTSLNQPLDREYLTSIQKNKLFEVHGSSCAICGTKAEAGVRGLQADHKIPLSRGGGNDITNWQPVCNRCNVGKRRACEDCELDCNKCSWAFPEIIGINSIIALNIETLKLIDQEARKRKQNRNEIIADAIECYLKNTK